MKKKILFILAVAGALLFSGTVLGLGGYFYKINPGASEVPHDTFTRGLVGYWDFDEGAGQTATDLSGNQNHGTLTNGPSWTKGQSSGGALSFDGADDYVDFGSVGEIKTISFWVKPGTTTEDIMETWGVSGDNVTFTYRGGSATYGTVSHNSECWLDRNLGASQIATAYNDSLAYGDLFQWGRLDDSHQDRASGTTSTNSATDNPGHSNFILEPNSPWDWRDPQNNNLWQGVSGINNPCPIGWRIPTEAELNTERLSWGTNNRTGAYASPLKLTAAGYRSHGSGSLSSAGSNGFYWSSAISGTDARYLHFTSDDAFMASLYRAYGFSVRCLKDNPASGISISGGTISAHDFVSPTIYVDGVVSSTIDTNWHLVTITSDTGLNASKLNIGKIGIGYFNGLIDQVRIYNRALSAAEVRYHYNRGGPVAEWNFDEGSGSIAYDSTGNGNDGVLTNMDDSDWVEGKYGTALDFDGTDDVATISQNSSINLTSKKGYTISSWIYPHSDGEADVGEIIDKGANTYLRVDSEATGLLDVEAKLDLATADATLNITDAVPINAWSHIVLTYEDDADDEITIYVNGINKGTSSDGNGAPATDSNNLLIGGDATANFDGLIDSVKIYSYARTADEILLDYNKGKAAHFGLSTTDCDNDPASCMDYGLVGNWGMDEGAGQTATDLSGNQNHGTLGSTTSADVNDPAWSKGQSSGGGLSFDGTDDYVDVASSSGDELDITSSFTIEAWIKSSGCPASGAMYPCIVIKRPGGSYDGYVLDLDYGGIPRVAFTTYDEAKGTTGCCDGNWHHVVAVHDDGNNLTKIYVDSVEEASETVATNPASTNANLHIGAVNATSGTFNGLIDQVRIYNRALSAAEVRYHYNRGGPVAEWNFDEGSGSIAYDSTGNGNDGVLTNMDDSDWVEGKYGTALDFDGTDDVATISQNSSINLTSKKGYTISSWIYPHSDGEADVGEIIDKGANTYLRVDSEATGLLDVEAKLDLATADATLNITDAVPINAWSHIVLTYEDDADDEITIYVNGINKGTSSDGNGAPATDSNNLLIGGDATANFDGLIDSVKIYSYARTADEILLDYNKGKAAHFGLSTTDCDNDPASCMDYGLVGNWGMDEGAGQTATDLSGNNNHGTLGADSSVGNDDPIWVSGGSASKGGDRTSYSGTALSFDGADDYVDLESDSSISVAGKTEFTWSAWVKYHSNGTFKALYCDTTANDYWRFFIGPNLDFCAGNEICFLTRDTSSGDSGTKEHLCASAPSLDEWYHYAAVYDSNIGTKKFYINGILDTSTNASVNPFTNTVSSKIHISAIPELTHFFNGQIDQVRIYNRALSAEEVRYHYNRGGPVAEWKMNERTGAKIYDSTSNNNDGKLNFGAAGTNTSYEDMWQGASDNLGIEFDGTDDYVDIGSLYDGVKTVEFWAKPTAVNVTEEAIDLNGTAYIKITSGTVSGEGFTTPTIYVNGITGTTITTSWNYIVLTTATGINASDFDIGRLNSSYFDGEINEVRIYNRVLGGGGDFGEVLGRENGSSVIS